MSDWWCNNCQFKIFGHKDRCKCGNTRQNNLSKSSSSSSSSSSSTRKNDWWCNKCKFNVFGSKDTCSKCNTSRENNANISSNECLICNTSDTRKKVLNCGHVVCSSCFEKITKCPFCKVTITSSIDLYI
jgi:hypothetical protein